MTDLPKVGEPLRLVRKADAWALVHKIEPFKDPKFELVKSRFTFLFADDRTVQMTDVDVREEVCLAMPAGLSPEGLTAYWTIIKFLREHDMMYTGGCKAFYSPAEWKRRGEEYGTESELVVVHDGGELGRLFNYDKEDYKCIEQSRIALEQVDLYAEAQTCWYSAIYKI